MKTHQPHVRIPCCSREVLMLGLCVWALVCLVACGARNAPHEDQRTRTQHAEQDQPAHHIVRDDYSDAEAPDRTYQIDTDKDPEAGTPKQ